ncbi:MAG: hypothetical protein L0211_14285 [Planctomycetaceae bacterium]|nr:hypothetical protein [Planctomycetaceae bacterium]
MKAADEFADAIAYVERQAPAAGQASRGTRDCMAYIAHDVVPQKLA